MKRTEVMAKLGELLPTVRDRFDVDALFVFGSVARDAAGSASDMDVLVDFRGPARFESFMGLKAFLEDEFGVRVDLVTRAALRPRMKPRIEAEAVRVA